MQWEKLNDGSYVIPVMEKTTWLHEGGLKACHRFWAGEVFREAGGSGGWWGLALGVPVTFMLTGRTFATAEEAMEGVEAGLVELLLKEPGAGS